MDLQLFDIVGRKYLSINLPGNSSGTFDVPVDHFPPGTYIVIVRQGNLTTNARIIIEKK
jgi:hypothetical protein